MCFSATASFVAGGSLSAAGGATLSRAKTKRELPLAAIPLLFGVQQLFEGIIWLTPAAPLGIAATYGYVMFSHVLWPFYLPLAVMLIEKSRLRRHLLAGFVFVGLAVSILLFHYLLQGPVTASITGRGIVYHMILPPVPHGLAAYVFATCVACMISSHVYIRVLGLALFGALAVSIWAYVEAFYSIWCFFAAVLSLIVFAHLYRRP